MRHIFRLIAITSFVVVVGCVPQSHQDTLHSTKISDQNLELTLELPSGKLTANKKYIAHAILIDKNRNPYLVTSESGTMADMFEIIAKDSKGKSLKVGGDAVETKVGGSYRNERIDIKKQISFNTPGRYEVFCRLTGAVFPVKGWPNIKVELETDPIKVQVE